MNLTDILAKCDHTLLTQTATWADIQAICDDGLRYHTASVCIPACYVKQAKDYVGDKLPICTVIGFPNGYDTTAAKCFMASDAVDNGADEVDMVINIGWAKASPIPERTISRPPPASPPPEPPLRTWLCLPSMWPPT